MKVGRDRQEGGSWRGISRVSANVSDGLLVQLVE